MKTEAHCVLINRFFLEAQKPNNGTVMATYRRVANSRSIYFGGFLSV